MLLKKSLVILLVISSISAFAQPSGYLGKRINLSYSALVSLPILYYSKDESKLFNYTNSFNLEWVVAQRKSIGLRYQNLSLIGNINDSQNDLTDAYYDNYDDVKGTYHLKVNTFSFDYIYYKSGWSAPLGSYRKLSLMYFQYSSENFLKDNSLVINTVDKVENFNFALAYTVGKRWVFNDIFTVNAAIQLGMYSPLFILNLQSTGRDHFKYKSDMRLFTYMLYNIEFGVGVLI